jgi:hypothetical protein
MKMQEKELVFSFFYRINICLPESRYLIHKIFNQLQQKKRGADFLMLKNTQKKILRPKSKNLFLQCELK